MSATVRCVSLAVMLAGVLSASEFARGQVCTVNADCDDGIFCNGDETCDPTNPNAGASGCVAGTPVNCDDGLSCTFDQCDDGQRACINFDTCPDAILCNGVEVCDPTDPNADGRGCVAGTPPSCDDSVPCTVDDCNTLADSCEHVLDDVFCDNNNACDGLETCDPDNPSADATGCAAGTPIDCDDGIACTVDTCDPATGDCTNTPSDALCDNGLFCDGAETCDPLNPNADARGCLTGTPPDCDDLVGCTNDSCDEANDVCVNTPDNSACDDTDPCNGLETCTAGVGCEAGTPLVCDDGDPCNGLESCTVGVGCELGVPLVCDDTDPCNGLETCTAGVGCEAGTPLVCENGDVCDGVAICVAFVGCQAGTPLVCDNGDVCDGLETCDPTNGCQPGTPLTCDNGVFCDGDETCDMTLGCQPGTPPCNPSDICDEAQRLCRGCATASECSDGLFCNGVEACVAVAGGGSTCLPGLDPCDDGIVCTFDACDEVNGCSNTPVDAACDNGDPCDGIDVCLAGVGCDVNPPPVCDDGNACNGLETCQALVGCVNGTPPVCDDGNACNGVETCDSTNGCEPGIPPNCDDGIGCTDDSCDATLGCVNAPNDANCDNSVFCDGPETCDARNDCQAGTPPVCDPATPICSSLVDACVQCEVDADCTARTAAAGTPFCDPATLVCVACLDNAQCDDGLACNGRETCVAHSCLGGTPVDCRDAFACTTDACVEPGGTCTHGPVDSMCDDTNACNGAETCDPSVGCVAGTSLICDDLVVCTADTCDATTGCVFTPNDATCSNGLACDGFERCDPTNGCQPGTPINCDDGLDCTADSCTEDQGGSCVHAPNDALCDDGFFCTGTEACDAQRGCVVSAPASCPLDRPFCDAQLDTCVVCRSDVDCDDGLVCNGVERCLPGVPLADGPFCAPGTPVNCDDAVDCTVDRCNEPDGTCSHAPDDAFCNDNDFCNGEETCGPAATVAGTITGCLAGAEPDCDDRNPCTVDTCAASACRHDPIADCIPPVARRASMNKKGSLLIFSKVELKWAPDGTLLQDTLLNISNDFPLNVRVQAYFVNGDAPIEELRADVDPFEVLRNAEPGWNTSDCRFRLTADQPVSWSAARGGSNCGPFSVLDSEGPGRPDPETDGHTRVLRGYVVMWAVGFNFQASQWQELRWNYLAGHATVVNYELGAAWEYNAWAFQAHGVANTGFLLTPGLLELDSFEYDQPYGTLIFDFYGSGSTALSAGDGMRAGVDTDLTLHPVSADFRQDNSGPVVTKVETEIWNEYESKFSGTVRCIQCWDETLISNYGAVGAVVNHYLRTFLGSDKGKARIDGVASTACDFLPPFAKASESAAMLGVAAKTVAFSNGSMQTDLAGMNLFGSDVEPAYIHYDAEQGPQTIIFDPGGSSHGRGGPLPISVGVNDLSPQHNVTPRPDDVAISPE